MNDVKQTVRLFKKLKAFPSLTLIVAYTISLEFIYALLLSYTLSGFVLIIQYLLQVYVYLLTLTFVTSIGSYIILYKDNSLTFRRHLIFTLLSITVFLVLWLLFSVLGILLNQNLFYFGFLIGFGLMTGFRLIVSVTVGSKRIERRIISSVFLPVLVIITSLYPTFIFFNSVVNVSTLITDELIIFGIWIIGSAIFLSLVDMPIKVLLDVHGLTMFRGFAEKWLSNRSDLFEESLDRISQQAKTKIDIGLFYREEDNSIKCLLINPWIHPGPFDEVGSSNLPYLLMTQLKKYGPIFVVHSATTHAFNIPKKDYVLKLIKAIDTHIQSTLNIDKYKKNLSKKATPLSRFKVNNKFQITYQLFDDYILSIFTASPNEVDDISPEVGELYLSSLFRNSTQVNDGTFIDAHNCISSLGENVFYESPLTHDLLSSSVLLLKELSTKSSCELKVGIAHRNFPFSLEEGYGPGGINILITTSCGKTGALIILDGNNMYPKIREKIISKISDLVDTVEILTTDTHVVNGISTTGFGYFPIGLKGNLDELINLIRDGIIEAKSNLERVTFRWTRLYVDTKILGESSLVKLLSGINISSKIAKYLILLLSPLLILISYLLVI